MMTAARDAASRGLGAVVRSPVFKPALFLACALPGILLGHDIWRFFVREDFEALGVDPNITVLHATGETAIRLLIASLAVTPLRRIFQVPRLQAVRRMLGLWSFAYAVLHLSAYLVFDQLCYSVATCQFDAIRADLLKRPFIFMGMTAFTVLLALAATSTAGWQRRLRRHWTRLHRLVYAAAAAAIVHYVWIQKSDYTEPLVWGGIVAGLLGIRLYFALRRRASASSRAAVTP